jgi:hypothetical protein
LNSHFYKVARRSKRAYTLLALPLLVLLSKWSKGSISFANRVESSIHRYVSKSPPFIGMYLNPSIHRRSGLKTSWRVMCKHQHNLLHLLIHLLLHTPMVIHYQIQGLLLSGAGLTNNLLSFLVKGGEAEADIDIR